MQQEKHGLGVTGARWELTRRENGARRGHTIRQRSHQRRMIKVIFLNFLILQTAELWESA